MQNVLIVGAGIGGSIMLDLLQKSGFMKVIAMIDKNPTAPGIQRAKQLQIPFATHWEAYLDDQLHIIFDVTEIGRAHV